MERRWTTRTDIRVNLEVATTDSVFAGCETRDIGLGGVFIRTNGHTLYQGENVELTFNLASASDGMAPMIRAKVVRLTDDGAGLMFKDFDAIAFRSLQKVIKSQEAIAL